MVAAKVGATPAMVRGWRIGKARPQLPTLARVVEETGVSWHWLMTGQEVKASAEPDTFEFTAFGLVKPPDSCPNQKVCLGQAKHLKLLEGIAGMGEWPKEARDELVEDLLSLMGRILAQRQESAPKAGPVSSAL
jgi:transcriptional regulator with XRE-family HTH domain